MVLCGAPCIFAVDYRQINDFLHGNADGRLQHINSVSDVLNNSSICRHSISTAILLLDRKADVSCKDVQLVLFFKQLHDFSMVDFKNK